MYLTCVSHVCMSVCMYVGRYVGMQVGRYEFIKHAYIKHIYTCVYKLYQ